MGSGNDLNLYHDAGGSGSHIQNDNGSNLTVRTTGSYLYIHGNNVHLRSQTGNETMLTAVVNNAVSLYYDASTYTTPKLQTTSNGILINAVRKKIVANNSKNDLIEIKGRILKHSFKFLLFEKEKNTRINKVQKIPLIKIDCSKFNSEAIIFIIASLATKPAIETLIKKAPTIFLEYDFNCDL